MTVFNTRTGLALMTAASLALSAPLFAMSSDDDSSSSSGSSSSASSSSGSAYERAREAAMAGRYDKAISMLNSIVAREPRNADAFNMLGYSHRKKGNYDKSFEFYGKALKLNPEHKGAHEYIGQAYLEQKDLPKAKLHLKRLDEICSWGCEEYDSLKRAIRSFETGSAPAEYKLDDDRG